MGDQKAGRLLYIVVIPKTVNNNLKSTSFSSRFPTKFMGEPLLTSTCNGWQFFRLRAGICVASLATCHDRFVGRRTPAGWCLSCDGCASLRWSYAWAGGLSRWRASLRRCHVHCNCTVHFKYPTLCALPAWIFTENYNRTLDPWYLGEIHLILGCWG